MDDIQIAFILAGLFLLFLAYLYYKAKKQKPPKPKKWLLFEKDISDNGQSSKCFWAQNKKDKSKTKCYSDIQELKKTLGSV